MTAAALRVADGPAAPRPSFGTLVDAGEARQWNCLGDPATVSSVHGDDGPPVDPAFQPLVDDGAIRVCINELGPGASLRPHTETHLAARTRYHLALTTNPEAVLVVDGRPTHVALGEVFAFDPWVTHHAVNHGTSPRVHLVWDVPR